MPISDSAAPKRKYSEVEMIGVLKQTEVGRSAAEV
jgi:hypothetical protein